MSLLPAASLLTTASAASSASRELDSSADCNNAIGPNAGDRCSASEHGTGGDDGARCRVSGGLVTARTLLGRRRTLCPFADAIDPWPFAGAIIAGPSGSKPSGIEGGECMPSDS